MRFWEFELFSLFLFFGSYNFSLKFLIAFTLKSVQKKFLWTAVTLISSTDTHLVWESLSRGKESRLLIRCWRDTVRHWCLQIQRSWWGRPVGHECSMAALRRERNSGWTLARCGPSWELAAEPHGSRPRLWMLPPVPLLLQADAPWLPSSKTLPGSQGSVWRASWWRHFQPHRPKVWMWRERLHMSHVLVKHQHLWGLQTCICKE